MDALQTGNKHSHTIYIVAGVLLLLLLFSFFQYLSVRSEHKSLQEEAISYETNQKVIAFTNLFINKVLTIEEDVEFEERLRLENMVRDIDDEEILSAWMIFVESKTEADAQKNVVDLLVTLINKIQ
tara:strand:- start:1162 stop:1539 length:378 start_codon:yes stop_codon:yes gene_type:complete